MGILTSHIVTGIITFVFALLLRELDRKARIVWWSPHSFLFEVPQPEAKPPTVFNLMTHAIAVRNVGRLAAENVEIVHKRRPDFFKLQPSRDYEEATTPAGEHVIRAKSLGPREGFLIQMLSYRQLPELQYIRSNSGPAQRINIALNRRLPRWLGLVLRALALIGAGVVVYVLLRIASFVLKGAGFWPSWLAQ
jgi:hypothetical protein